MCDTVLPTVFLQDYTHTSVRAFCVLNCSCGLEFVFFTKLRLRIYFFKCIQRSIQCQGQKRCLINVGRINV